MLFILGRGRSGTTLLATMLNRHAQISTPPEALFIMTLYAKYRNAAWDRGTIIAFQKDLLREVKLSRWSMDHDALMADLLSLEGSSSSYADYCTAVHRQYAKQQGKSESVIIGNKNPGLSMFAEVLVNCFPNAKFIHIIRDYRDNIESFRVVRFDLNNISALAFRWKAYVELVDSVASRYPDRFITVRFEDLVSDPGTELKRICAFLKVGYTDAMLQRKVQRDRVDLAWHANVARPLDSGIIGKWRRSLSPKDAQKAELVCDATARRFGYRSELPKNKALLPATLPGVAYGWFVTFLEKNVYRLPVALQMTIINGYRRMTKSITSAKAR